MNGALLIRLTDSELDQIKIEAFAAARESSIDRLEADRVADHLEARASG